MEPDLIELLTRAAPATEAVLARLGPEEAGRPSPCPAMTVSQVAAHLIGGLRGFTTVGEGGELSFGADSHPDIAAEDAAAAFRAAVDGLVGVFGRAGRIEATFAMPWGPTTGAQLVGFELIETIVHGWDVSRGLGVDLALDDDVAAAALAGARQWVDDSIRVFGMFGPEVQVSGAGPLEELVAFLGRDPAWTPLVR